MSFGMEKNIPNRLEIIKLLLNNGANINEKKEWINSFNSIYEVWYEK